MLRSLTAGDLPAIDTLRESIGWGAGSWFLGPMMTAGGCVLGLKDDNGQLVAMGGTAVFGSTGFICSMVVRPEVKRRGLGRTVFEGLLAWLSDRGVTQVQLEATDEGKPLYEQYGFRTRWESVSSHKVNEVPAGDDSGLRPATETDWPAIAALDRLAYGGDRTTFLRALLEGPYERDFLVASGGGRVVGYGLRLSQRIGPLVGETCSVAETLARALAVRSAPGTWATIGHPQHSGLWRELGFDVREFDTRMVFGPEPDDRPGMVISMLNGGVG